MDYVMPARGYSIVTVEFMKRAFQGQMYLPK